MWHRKYFLRKNLCKKIVLFSFVIFHQFYEKKFIIPKMIIKTWELFLGSRANTFQVASHIISCSVQYNSRLVKNVSFPVELHFPFQVCHFYHYLFNHDNCFRTEYVFSWLSYAQEWTVGVSQMKLNYVVKMIAISVFLF